MKQAGNHCCLIKADNGVKAYLWCVVRPWLPVKLTGTPCSLLLFLRKQYFYWYQLQDSKSSSSIQCEAGRPMCTTYNAWSIKSFWTHRGVHRFQALLDHLRSDRPWIWTGPSQSTDVNPEPCTHLYLSPFPTWFVFLQQERTWVVCMFAGPHSDCPLPIFTWRVTTPSRNT